MHATARPHQTSSTLSHGLTIEQWLQSRLTTEQMQWFEDQINKIVVADSDRDLHITLGLIPRRFGHADLNPTEPELLQAQQHINGWNPAHWSIDTAARIAVICHVADQRGKHFDPTISDLIRNADLAESIALYSGLPLYPRSTTLDQLVGDGLRTNIRTVFEAIAHNNPYPASHFDDNRWNHMVLKALFIESRLAPIVGLDSRANAELAEILCDYAHERWAANRPVSYELWRCVGPFAKGAMIDDLERAANSSDTTEKLAALLALSAVKNSQASDILNRHPLIKTQITNGTLCWSNLEKQKSKST